MSHRGLPAHGGFGLAPGRKACCMEARPIRNGNPTARSITGFPIYFRVDFSFLGFNYLRFVHNLLSDPPPNPTLPLPSSALAAAAIHYHWNICSPRPIKCITYYPGRDRITCCSGIRPR